MEPLCLTRPQPVKVQSSKLRESVPATILPCIDQDAEFLVKAELHDPIGCRRSYRKEGFFASRPQTKTLLTRKVTRKDDHGFARRIGEFFGRHMSMLKVTNG